MNLGINQSMLSSALVASISLHGVGIAVLTSTLFSSQLDTSYLKQPEIPVLKTIEVTLSALPEKALAKNQSNTVSALNNQPKTTPTEIKERVPTKVVKTEHVRAASKSGISEKTSVLPKTKPNQLSAQLKELYRQSLKKPEIVVSKYNDNAIPSHRLPLMTDARKDMAAMAKKPTSQALPIGTGNTDAKSSANPTSGAKVNQLAMAYPHLHDGGGSSSSLPPLLKSREPDYPEEARWEERTGKTTLKFKISGAGRVIEPSITKSSGHRDLDMAAIRAIQFWRFKAQENLAANQWFHYSFRFELN